MYVIQILASLIVLGAIVFLAYITTRFVGSKANNAMRGKYINVVETVSLGMDKRIHLVKAGEQYVLIASCGRNVEFLTEIKLDISEAEASQAGTEVFDFKGLLEKYLHGFKKKGNANGLNESNTQVEKTAGYDSRLFGRNLERIKNIASSAVKQGIRDGDENTNEK